MRGVSISDISKAIKVQEKILKALERDCFDELPAPTFVKGFIKAFAKYLGLDVNDAVLRYEHYLQENAVEEKKPLMEAMPSTASPFFLSKRIMTVALLSVGVAVIVLYYVLTGGLGEGEKTVATAPPEVVEAKPAPLKKASLKKALKPLKVTKSKEKAAVKKAVVAKTPKAQERSKVVEKPKAVEKAAAVTPTIPVVVQEKLSSAAPASQASQTAPAATPGHKLLVRANETTWMRLTIDDKTPREVTLKAGEKVEWSAKDVFFCS